MVFYNIEVAMQNAFLNSISERQVPLTKLGGVCSHLPVSWLLRMVRLVAAGIRSVMRLSSCSCGLSLDVRIAAFAAAVVCVCLAFSKVVSSFSALMR